MGIESTNILPEIANYSDKEQLFNDIRNIRDKKRVIKSYYKKEQIDIHTVIK